MLEYAKEDAVVIASCGCGGRYFGRGAWEGFVGLYSFKSITLVPRQNGSLKLRMVATV
jgi:hypothetical protein